VRCMLMICDDESDDRDPLELVGNTEHVAWIDYMDRPGISFLDGVRLRPSTDATKVAQSRRRIGHASIGRMRALAQFERRVVVRAVPQSTG
jgi:hypothetical protein